MKAPPRPPRDIRGKHWLRPGCRRTHPAMTSASGAPPEPAVRVAGLRVDRGGRRVLDGLDFAIRRGHGDRSARPERLRQDDAHPRDRRRAADPSTAPSRCSALPAGRAGAAPLGSATSRRRRRVYRRPHGRARTCATSPPCSASRPAARRGRSTRWTSATAAASSSARLSGGQRVARLARLRAAGRARAARARRAHRRARPGAAPRPLAAVPRARGRAARRCWCPAT